jgi:hypothetical protein
MLAAPDLMREAVLAGVCVGWDPHGGVFAQLTSRSRRQRAAFEALMDNHYSPDVLQGTYYAGDFQRWQ